MAIQIALSEPPVAWELDTPADMFAALVELVDRGYRGLVDCYRPAESGERVWILKVVEDVAVPQNPPAECRIGERLILAGGVLRRMSAAEFGQVTV